MAKQIIVIGTGNPWPGQLSVQYVLWATVPTNLSVMFTKDTSWTSAYANATTTELASLRSGATTELVSSTNIPLGTGVPTIKTILESAFTRFQNSVTNNSTWQYFGTSFDGATWTNGGL